MTNQFSPAFPYAIARKALTLRVEKDSVYQHETQLRETFFKILIIIIIIYAFISTHNWSGSRILYANYFLMFDLILEFGAKL